MPSCAGSCSPKTGSATRSARIMNFRWNITASADAERNAMATAPVQDPTIVEFDVRTDEMLVNMGPQHPSTHGVLRLVLRTDGEIISEVTPHLGYLHRCAEKIGENVTPIQFIPYTDRMDYLAAMNMNLGYSLAVEKLCGMKLPEKANVIRVIIAEMNRISSHLVAMGTYGLDLGTFSPFLYAFREREQILDLLEAVCGARLTYSYITLGGPPADLPPGWLEHCKTFLERPRGASHRAAAAPAGRGVLRRDRMPARADGLPRRRLAAEDERAAPGAGQVVVLREPERDQRDLSRLPDRGRAGDCRFDRHR